MIGVANADIQLRQEKLRLRGNVCDCKPKIFMTATSGGPGLFLPKEMAWPHLRSLKRSEQNARRLTPPIRVPAFPPVVRHVSGINSTFPGFNTVPAVADRIGQENGCDSKKAELFEASAAGLAFYDEILTLSPHNGTQRSLQVRGRWRVRQLPAKGFCRTFRTQAQKYDIF